MKKIVPFGLKREQFAVRWRRELERASDATIARLRALFVETVPPEVLAAEVEIFLNEDGAEGVDVWIYFGGENNRVDNANPAIFPGRSLALALPLDAMGGFSEKYFDGDFPGADLAAEATQAWFAECWWKAGGWSYPLPVDIGVHDGFGGGKTVRLTERGK